MNLIVEEGFLMTPGSWFVPAGVSSDSLVPGEGLDWVQEDPVRDHVISSGQRVLSNNVTEAVQRAAFRYRRDPWHPVTLPLDLGCRHTVQRLVLVFSNAEQQVWVLLVRGGLKQ